MCPTKCCWPSLQIINGILGFDNQSGLFFFLTSLLILYPASVPNLITSSSCVNLLEFSMWPIMLPVNRDIFCYFFSCYYDFFPPFSCLIALATSSSKMLNKVVRGNIHFFLTVVGIKHSCFY